MQKRKFSQKCWEILALPTKTVGYTCLKFETRPSTCGFGLTYQNTDQFHPIPTKPMLDVSTPRLTISTVLTCGLLLFMCCLFSAIEEVFFHLQLSRRWRQVYLSSHCLSSTMLTLLRRCSELHWLRKSHTESQHVLASHVPQLLLSPDFLLSPS